MTIYIYARVSKDEATFRCCDANYPLDRETETQCPTCGKKVTLTKPASVEAQIDRCRKYAELYHPGQAVVVVWEVVSAHTPLGQREQGGKLLAALGEGDRLIATRIDRAFRNLKDMCDTISTAERLKWSMCFVDQKIDISDASGRLILHIMAAVAEHEWHTTSQRRKKMAEFRKQKELYNGGPVPTGKRVVFDNGQKRLEDDPAQAKLARICIEQQARRTPLLQLLHFANTHGYRNAEGQPYSRSALDRLMQWGKREIANGNPIMFPTEAVAAEVQ